MAPRWHGREHLAGVPHKTNARSATLVAMKRLRIPALTVLVAATLLSAGDSAPASGGTPLWVLQQNRRAAEQYQRERAERVMVAPTPAQTPTLAIPTPPQLDPGA